jgi:hypothetical protein
MSSALRLAVGVTPKTSGGVAHPAVAQESVSLHLTLDNLRGATTSTCDKNNFLLVKLRYVLSSNNRGGGELSEGVAN